MFHFHEGIPALEYTLNAGSYTVCVDEARAALQTLNAFLVLLLHTVQVHVELIVLVLHVEDGIFEELLSHFFKILVGVAARDVEVAIDTSAFDVDGE